MDLPVYEQLANTSNRHVGQSWLSNPDMSRTFDCEQGLRRAHYRFRQTIERSVVPFRSIAIWPAPPRKTTKN